MEDYKMDSIRDEFQSFSDAISRFVIGYNKSVVLHTITMRSLDIIIKNIKNVQDGLETIVAAFEEIRATSASSTENVTDIDKRMKSIVEANVLLNTSLTERVEEITKTGENATKLVEIFERLVDESKSIQGMSAAIQDVSDRTNILAINASIEAARAGESGKGFRIIANEIRNLALQTRDFAKEIEKSVGGFTKLINEIYEYIFSFHKVLKDFERDISNVKSSFVSTEDDAKQVGDSIAMISQAIQEQTLALNDGLKSLEGVFEAIQDTNIMATALGKTYIGLSNLLNKKS